MSKHIKCMMSIIITLILSVTSIYAQFERTENDVANEYVEFLNDLGIFEEFTQDANLGGYLTRAEAAALTVKLLGMGEEAVFKPGENIFDDVAADHDYAGYIYYAKSYGIISGFNDYIFNPDSTITFSEALKMFVSCLGYSPAAESKGGYPGGYIIEATELGLLKGIDYSSGENLTRLKSARMIYNMLEVDMMSSNYSPTGQNYKTVHGKTILNNLGIKKIEGAINANYLTGIKGNKVSKGFIKINDTLLKIDDEKAADAYIGANARAYYKENTLNENEVLNIQALKKGFSKIKLDASMISEVSDNTIKYYISSAALKETNCTIEANTVLIYNNAYYDPSDDGKTVSEIIDEVCKAGSGSIYLFDNDGSGTFDLVHIFEYQTYAAHFVNETNKMIYTKEGVSISYDKLMYDNVIITAAGQSGSIKMIKENSVLMIGHSKDNRLLLIEISGYYEQSTFVTPPSITGMIKEIREVVSDIPDSIDENGIITDYKKHLILLVDGKEYETPLLTNQKANSYKKLSPGMECIFYLDSNEKIALFTIKTSSSDVDAYLLGIGKTGQALSDNVKIKVFDLEDGVKYYNVDKKVRYYQNGSQLSSIKYSFDLLNNQTDIYDPNTKTTLRQLIRFSVNNDANVVEIHTAATNFMLECGPVVGATPGAAATGFSYDKYMINQGDIKAYSTQENNMSEVEGLLPINVYANEKRSDNDIGLRLHYQNYDLGDYVRWSWPGKSLSPFSFYRFNIDAPETSTIKGIIRNVNGNTAALSDIADNLNNLPGRLSRHQGGENNAINYGFLDYRYLITPETKILMIPGFVDSDGMIYDSLDADEEEYKAIALSNMYNTDSQILVKLYNIGEDYKVGCMVVINRESLPGAAKKAGNGNILHISPIAVVKENPSIVSTLDGDKYKLKVLIMGVENSLYIPVSKVNEVKDDGQILKHYRNDFSGPIDTLGLWGMESYKQLAAAQPRYQHFVQPYGLYEGMKVSNFNIGTVFQFSKDQSGDINGIRVIFDHKRVQEYYPEGLDNKDVKKSYYYETNYNNIIDKFENSSYYNYDKTQRNSVGVQLQGATVNQSVKHLTYGKVITNGLIVQNHGYVVIKTALPMWGYYDDNTPGNAPHQIVPINENYRGEWEGKQTDHPAPKEIIRSLNTFNSFLTPYILDVKAQKLTLCSFEDIMKDDEIFISFGHSEERGCVMIIR
ncbi:MAG: S-layer homology domain-containing protein [Firmicutes bacterium]|nr:S-layer homology domain-containing protein [Bacillota bacterium]